MNSQIVQGLDALDHLLDLSSRVLGRRRPQPTLHTGAGLVRLCQRGAPSLQQTRLNRVRDPARQLRFMLAASGGNHRSKPALVDNDEPMIVEPAPRKAEKALRIVGAREFLAHHAHEAATIMLAEPAKAQRLTSQLLMFDQGRSAAIHRTQRGQVRSGDVEARAQMLPQQRRDDPHRFEKTPAHPQKANLQCQSELQLRPAPLLDDPALLGRKLIERLDLECSDFARQMPQPQKCRVPTVHRALPVRATINLRQSRSASR